MQQEKFTLENLKDLGYGIVNEAFAKEMTLLAKDCEDRPLEEKSRNLTLVFKLTPKVDTSGNTAHCDGVHLEVEIAGKTPVRRTRIFDMKLKNDGSLFFHPDLPEDADGDALYDKDVIDRERNGAA